MTAHASHVIQNMQNDAEIKPEQSSSDETADNSSSSLTNTKKKKFWHFWK